MSEGYKRLYRSRDDRMISGVCGGISQYFNVDPTLIRLLFIIFAFAGVGSGVLAYIVLAIIVPEEPLGDVAPSAAPAEPPAPEAEAEESE